MGDINDIVNPHECPVCGFSAESKQELAEHFEEKSTDEEHQEYMIDEKDRKEVIDEDSVGPEAGTPGHPGIDEGTTD